jgi:hypothetical protein
VADIEYADAMMRESIMLLHHYSARKIAEIISKVQRPVMKPYDRPTGFWVSVVGPNDWKSKHRGELLDQNLYEVTLAGEHNLLFMNTREHLSVFTKAYGIKLNGETRIAIDWAKVAPDYQGVIIAPFFTKHEDYDDLFWYGAWGCASGCIWDKNAIAGISLVREGDQFLGLKYLPTVSFE